MRGAHGSGACPGGIIANLISVGRLYRELTACGVDVRTELRSHRSVYARARKDISEFYYSRPIARRKADFRRSVVRNEIDAVQRFVTLVLVQQLAKRARLGVAVVYAAKHNVGEEHSAVGRCDMPIERVENVRYAVFIVHRHDGAAQFVGRRVQRERQIHVRKLGRHASYLGRDPDGG